MAYPHRPANAVDTKAVVISLIVIKNPVAPSKLQ